MNRTRSRIRACATGCVLLVALSNCGDRAADQRITASDANLAAAGSNLPPVADPGGPYNGRPGVDVKFDGSGSSDPDGPTNKLTYAWNFGDGTTGTGVRPSRAYSAPGTYTVTLTVTDHKGATGTAATVAVVRAIDDSQPPVADPGGPYSGTVGTALQFDGSGSSDPDGDLPLTYAWNFGDGTTGTGVNPSKTYPAAGTYTVTLTVTDALGTSSEPATTTVTIGGGELPRVQVSIVRVISGRDYRVGVTGLTTGSPVYIDRDHTYQTVPAVVQGQTYILTADDDWDHPGFGSFLRFTIDREATVFVAFLEGANRPTWLQTNFTPTDHFVQVSKGTEQLIFRLFARDYPAGLVEIGSNRPGNSTAMYTVMAKALSTGGNQPPVANPGGPYSGTPGTALQFDGSGSSDPDGDLPLTYAWNFGDGTTGTGVNPSKTYAAANTYTVTLTVTDARGASSPPASTTATVASAPNQPPVANPGGPYSATVGSPITLNGSGSSDPDGDLPLTYAWNFGDGTTGTGVSPSKTYTAAGSYTVSLVVTDARGASSASATTTVSVGAAGGGNGPPPIGIAALQAASGRVYRDELGGLANGAKVYIDRVWTYDEVPGLLQGQTFIQTAQGDQDYTGNSFLSFRLSRTAKVYVAYGNVNAPAWLTNGFTNTGQSLVIAKDAQRTPHYLWVREFPAGLVTIPGNRQGGVSGPMYTVIVEGVPGANGPFASTTTGFHHSCSLTPVGRAYCWGYNTNRGQVGDGTFVDRNVPVAVVGGLTFSTVSGGAYHTCALTHSGQAYCWGRNNYGQLGNGSTTDRNTPGLVSGGHTFVAISSGEFSTCALTAAGQAYCWGRNNRGQLGTNSTTNSSVPQAVVGGRTFVALSLGYLHACGIVSDGRAFCWGKNSLGQLGDGTTTDRRVPVQVVGGLTFMTTSDERAIDAAQNDTCALTSVGKAYCWGDNWHNQLGTNVGRDFSSTPAAVAGVPNFTSITVGGDHACAITGAGVVWCWGDNLRGQLGHENRVDYNPPARIETPLTFARANGGWDHYCGVTTDGDVYCWGWNHKGQLGEATTASFRTSPRLVAFP